MATQNTKIHLSIDDGPERILEMGRELTDDEKARVKAAGKEQKRLEDKGKGE